MKMSAGKHLEPKWTPPRSQGVPSAKQVYAFAFHTYRDGISDHDWSEDIKTEIARGHFDAANADTITLAIRMVSKRVGRRDPIAVRGGQRGGKAHSHSISVNEAKSILATIKERYYAQRKHEATEPDAGGGTRRDVSDGSKSTFVHVGRCTP